MEAYSDLGASSYYSDPEIREQYPDDEAYDLWPVGVPKKFGFRHRAIYFCRRVSITVICPKCHTAGCVEDAQSGWYD